MEAAEGERQAQGRLLGWKQIAAYLGVSRRTAQVWVRTRGLPVRRLPGGRGGVFAETAELDAWMRNEHVELRQGRLDRQKRRAQLARISLAAPFIVAAVIFGLWRFVRAKAVAPTSVVLEGETLEARDRDGRPLWRYRFEAPAKVPGARLEPQQSQASLADVDADGRQEVFVSLGYRFFLLGSPDALAAASIAFLSPEGALRWRREPVSNVPDANGAPFPPHWMVGALTIVRAAGRDRIWLSLNHWERFPGVIVEVLPDGSLRDVFANHGHINSLAAVERNGKPAILAGGSTNALRGSILAVIDPDAGFSKAPEAGPARYRFARAASAAPAAYYWIPPRDMTEASLTDVDHIYSFRTEAGSPVAVIAVGNTEACKIFIEMDRAGRPLRSRRSAACEMEHRRYEQQGVIRHPFERCPDFQQPLELRLWTEKGTWEVVKIPMATMRNTI